jgi:putative transposase
VSADGGYNRVPTILACFLLGLTLLIVSRPRVTKGFVLLPRRWVVKRTLGWLGRLRRLSRDYEQLPEVCEAMITIAMIRLQGHSVLITRCQGRAGDRS